MTSLHLLTLIDRGSARHIYDAVGHLGDVLLYNTCYDGVPSEELDLPDDDYASDRGRTNVGKDSVKPMTKEEQAVERALSWGPVKSLTLAIFKMDVTRFSFPVGYCEPRTFIERASDLFAFLVSGSLERAFLCRDPVDCLAMVGIGIAGSFYLYLQPKKPWNRVHGETYVGQWPDGTAFYGEQISHHLAITVIQICTLTNRWRIDAQFCFAIDHGMLKVDILQRGRTKLEFEDRTIFEWEFPTIRALGILKGDRVVRIKKPFVVKDLTNHLEFRFKVAPKPNKKR
jgi:hypothetical protein